MRFDYGDVDVKSFEDLEKFQHVLEADSRYAQVNQEFKNKMLSELHDRIATDLVESIWEEKCAPPKKPKGDRKPRKTKGGDFDEVKSPSPKTGGASDLMKS